jgi:hypothetical protein
MQLDIFADSRDVMLRNDVLDALARRHIADSRQAWQRLADEYPGDDTLPALATLIGTLEEVETAGFTDHGALGAARRTLSEEVGPAAIRLFGQQAGREWLIPCWRKLAQRATSLAFRSDDSDNHAAPLWLIAGEWDAGIQAVARIESWRRMPAPLMWIAHAHYRADGLESTWPLLVELAWLSPRRFATLLADIADTALDALRKKFDTQFEGTGQTADLAWFPAWALIEKAALLPRIREAQPSLHTPPERAARLIAQILDLEKRGDQHELPERRRELRSLHAGLYGTYMKTR